MLLRRCSAGITMVVFLACVAALAAIPPAGAEASAGLVVGAKHKPKHKAKPKPHRAVGQPPLNWPAHTGVVFSYPNRGKSDQRTIRKRILHTIKSTWGGRRDSLHAAGRTSGSIRIATWSFDDMKIARALYAAHKRGVSVQVVAAKKANRGSGPWRWLRKHLRSRLYAKGHPSTISRWSFARNCKGSCRGRGGTPHAKYLLFRNVGSTHQPVITMQTSANLTTMAFTGQWNEMTTTKNGRVYLAFARVFAQARRDKPVRSPYRHYTERNVQSMFFPRPGTTAPYDPVMRTLSHVHCTGASTKAGNSRGRTKIRVVQYAMYSDRGVWIAKRLRALWHVGCDVKLIYSAMSGPVFRILRARTGRGPIPMRQSVIRDGYGTIVKYNHNKWMTVTGHWGRWTNAYVVLSGSANWGDAAFNGDEQMQEIHSRLYAVPHLNSFGRTWRQRSSHAPRPGPIAAGARMLPDPSTAGYTEEVHFGQGVYEHMEED